MSSTPGTSESARLARATPGTTLAVGLCTFRRLEYLERSLKHVLNACAVWGQHAHVIVVDNDGTDPQVRACVERFQGQGQVSLHFSIETLPGIAAARNAVFARAEALGVRYLAMLDDDEWPEPQWLVELMAEHKRTGAVVVGGPVQPHFPVSRKQFERLARYWSVERQWLYGKPFVFCTCNFLVDLLAIRAEPRPLFDAAFGLSGGEDVVFFRRLFFQGHSMAWNQQARVHEEVPLDRASLSWMRRRRFGVGFNAVRWERMNGALRALAKTLGLTLRLPIYPLMGREPESRWVGWLLEAEKVRGRYAAHLGGSLQQYAHDTPDCR